MVFIKDMNMYKGISKHSWKKFVSLLWTVLTYLLKNVEYGIEHDIAYGVCIGTLDVIISELYSRFLPCNSSRW